MAAQEEANAYIKANRQGAADTFLRIAKVKLSQADVEQMLADKGTQFSTTPNGIMQYALFMSKAGTIKSKPTVWSDPFVASLKSKSGS
jgi:NitT/TauT family transport system substrate-binding protein